LQREEGRGVVSPNSLAGQVTEKMSRGCLKGGPNKSVEDWKRKET